MNPASFPGHNPNPVAVPGTLLRPARRPGQRSLTIWLYYLCLCFITFPLISFVSIPNIPVEHEALAYALLFVCTLPVVTHLTAKHVGLPVFPIVCMVYAVMYALPVFISKPIVVCMTAKYGIRSVSSPSVTLALVYALIGVLAMQGGFSFFRFSMLHLLIPRVRLELDVEKSKRWVIPAGIGGIVLSWLTLTHQVVIPDRFNYITYLLTKQASLCIALLAFYAMREGLGRKEKMTLFGLVIAQILLALASGTIREVLEPLIILGAVYWTRRRRFPMRYAIIAVLLYGIIQPIKAAYREEVWKRGYASDNIHDRLVLWGTLLTAGWEERHELNKAMSNTQEQTALTRIDIIHMFARVVEMTPRRIPYQLGETYNYLIYALIPRAIWPDKPSASSANQFFGVSYEFQTPESVGDTSIGLPHLAEAYINFGPLGIIFIMMIIGMVYAGVDRLFDHSEAGGGGVAIYAVILNNLWTIETATAPTFGALIQTIIVYGVFLSFVRERKPLKAAPVNVGAWQGIAQ